MSYVGNVLGVSGNVGMAGAIYIGPWNGGPAMYMLGNGNEPQTQAPKQDPKIIDMSFNGHVWREGNWDWVTSSQTWTEQSAGALPNSAYMPNAGGSPPAFWGGNTWPWVVPSTGLVLTLPAKARYDAWVLGGPNPAL